jgi:hypothetical protein
MTKVLVDKAVIDRAIDALASQQVMAQDEDGNYTINATPKHVMDSLAELRALAAQAAETEPEWYHGIDQHGCNRFYHKTEVREARCNTPLYTHPAPAAKPMSDAHLLAIKAKLMQKGYADGDEWDAALIDAVINEFCKLNGIKEQS